MTVYMQYTLKHSLSSGTARLAQLCRKRQSWSPEEHKKCQGCIFICRCRWHDYNANAQHSSGSHCHLTVVKHSERMTKPTDETEPAGRAGNFTRFNLFHFEVSVIPRACTGSAKAERAERGPYVALTTMNTSPVVILITTSPERKENKTKEQLRGRKRKIQRAALSATFCTTLVPVLE